MMIIYIIGAILFFIVLLLWKNSYYKRRPIYEIEEYERLGVRLTREGKLLGYEYYDKIESPLWLFLLFIVAFLIPFVNIIVPIFIIIRMLCESDIQHYIHFNENTFFGKVGRFFKRIGKFLNKDVF